MVLFTGYIITRQGVQMTTNTEMKMEDDNSPIHTCLTYNQTRFQERMMRPLVIPKIRQIMESFTQLRTMYGGEFSTPSLKQIHKYFTRAKHLRTLYNNSIEFKYFDSVERMSADYFLAATGFKRYSDRVDNEFDIGRYEDCWINYKTGCFIYIEYLKEEGCMFYWSDSENRPVSHRFDKDTTEKIREKHTILILSRNVRMVRNPKKAKQVEDMSLKKQLEEIERNPPALLGWRSGGRDYKRK